MRSDTTLTLYIPDLFGFESTLSKLTQDEKSQLSEFKTPVLDKWLSRGLKKKSLHQDDIIFSEFGLYIDKSKAKNTELPYAALSLLAENNTDLKISDLFWLRADPVCMQPDRDAVILTAHEALALSQDEAERLVENINTHFIDEPWTLYACAPHRWYLGLETPADLITSPLSKVLGENVNHFLSTGDDAHYWLTITNEIQMLLHGTNVNFERESRNMMTANSIWLWGGGYLPSNKVLNSSHHRIITNNIFFSGVGCHCNLEVLSLSDGFSDNVEVANDFIVLDMLSEHVQSRDLYTFMQTLTEIETVFFSYCDKQLQNGKIDSIRLVTDTELTVTITKKHLHRWWKRIKPFTDFRYA